MALTKDEEIQLGRILRSLCAEGFISEAKELANLPDDELSRRLVRLQTLAGRIAANAVAEAKRHGDQAVS